MIVVGVPVPHFGEFTTAFTPCTFFAIFSACVFCFFVGRLLVRDGAAVLGVDGILGTSPWTSHRHDCNVACKREWTSLCSMSDIRLRKPLVIPLWLSLISGH